MPNATSHAANGMTASAVVATGLFAIIVVSIGCGGRGGRAEKNGMNVFFLRALSVLCV